MDGALAHSSTGILSWCTDLVAFHTGYCLPSALRVPKMLHISTEMKTHRASGQCCSDLTNEQAVFEEKSLDRIREPSHRSYFEWRGKKVN